MHEYAFPSLLHSFRPHRPYHHSVWHCPLAILPILGKMIKAIWVHDDGLQIKIFQSIKEGSWKLSRIRGVVGAMALLMSFWQKKGKKSCLGGKAGKAGKGGTDWICCHLLMLKKCLLRANMRKPVSTSQCPLHSTLENHSIQERKLLKLFLLLRLSNRVHTLAIRLTKIVT